jgi:hypothetical protein
MARPHRRLGGRGLLARALGVAVFVLLVASVPAAALRALHVDALSMRADRTQLQVGQVFHLSIHAHVRERIAALDELVVPDVGTMKLEGDERHVTSTPSGTDVIETLTLEPTQSGSFTFSGAYLDAIDARTGKPSRFSANPVRVGVAAPGYRLPTVQSIAQTFVAVSVIVALVAGVVVAIVLVLRVPRAVAGAVPAPVAPPPALRRTPRDDVADALRAYRVAPANGSLTRLRETLFAAAGTPGGATLRDALAATADQPLRAALVAAERTAFGPAHVRDSASADLVAATEGWLR